MSEFVESTISHCAPESARFTNWPIKFYFKHLMRDNYIDTHTHTDIYIYLYVHTYTYKYATFVILDKIEGIFLDHQCGENNLNELIANVVLMYFLFKGF